MSGDAVFIVCSIALIFAYTAYMIWTMRRRQKLLAELAKLVEEAKKKEGAE